MRNKKELEQLGCHVLTTGGTGLKVTVSGEELALLHLTPTGMAVGSAHLDVKNARRLCEEIEKALGRMGSQQQPPKK